MTGGPPDSTPMMRTPDNAVQDVTILNEKPTMPKRLKLRFNSTRSSVWRTQGIRRMFTLGIAELRKHIIIAVGSINHLFFVCTICHIAN